MRKIICPVSSKRVNENVVRTTAFLVILIIGLYMLIPDPIIALFLAIDFFIRAFTRMPFSPLSWLAAGISRGLNFGSTMIDKAPKIFAARIGLLFSVLMFLFPLLGMTGAGMITASVLALFAFLECGLNFCAGCWVYTYIVVPIYRER